jgi:CubicO group peptidase (beta-lactamase class C family)
MSQKLNRTFADICASLERRMSELGVPGVSIGLLHGDAEMWAGFGVTSVTNPLPVTPDTLFQCGSITKTFVGTAAMHLVDKGMLDLDAPVRALLPDFRVSDADASARATLRTLLTHSGGWLGDYFDDLGFGDDAIARIVASMAQLPQWTPIGSTWSYNNIGFAAAGRMIEVATGHSFESVVRAAIFEPLTMTSSTFFPTEVMIRRFAIGHNVIAGRHTPAAPWEIGRSNHPAGGLTTTVIDLLRYARCHIENGRAPDGTQVLSKRAAQAMRQPQLVSTGRYEQGLTWWLTRLAGKSGDQIIQHGGATNGFCAHLRIVPAQRFAIAILTNSDIGSQLYDPVSHLALQLCLEASLDRVEAIKVPAASTQAYAGRYAGYLANQTVRVHKGRLFLKTLSLGRFPTPTSPVHGDAEGPEVELAFYDRDRVFVASDGLLGARGEFLRDGRGRISMLRWGGRTHAKAQ